MKARGAKEELPDRQEGSQKAGSLLSLLARHVLKALLDYFADKDHNQDDSIAQSLRKEVLENYEKDYDFHTKVFVDLDVKTRGTTTIAGVFLAAVFAFVRQPLPTGSQVHKAAIISAVIFLVLSVLISLLAIRVRTLSARPPATLIRQITEDVISAGDVNELLPGYFSEQINMWNIAIDKLQIANKKKGQYLYCSQLLLLLSILCVALVTINDIVME